jgi:hypothetical protein
MDTAAATVYVQKRQETNPTAAASIQRSNSELRRYISQLRVAQGAKWLTVKLALAKRRPGNYDRVSTTRVLGQPEATYRMMNVHTQVICVRLPRRNQLLESNKFWPSKQTNTGESFGLSHLPTVGEKRTSGQYYNYMAKIHKRHVCPIYQYKNWN